MTRQSPLEYEHFSSSQISLAGVDEAGRGSLFGAVTVVAVAVTYDQWQRLLNESWVTQVRDSKKISPIEREQLFKEITSTLPYSLAHVSTSFIDKYNINIAVQYGLYRSILSLQNQLTIKLDSFNILMDGNYNFRFPHLRMPRHAQLFSTIKYIPRGDDLSFTIGAASIVAKVSRDRLMQKAHMRFPNYALDKHKGYGTQKHRLALQQFGATKFHRKSFLRNILGNHTL